MNDEPAASHTFKIIQNQSENSQILSIYLQHRTLFGLPVIRVTRLSDYLPSFTWIHWETTVDQSVKDKYCRLHTVRKLGSPRLLKFV